MYCLVLNIYYMPIGVIDSIDALVDSLTGKGEILEEYTEHINSTKQSFRLPAVYKSNTKYVATRHVNYHAMEVFIRDNYSCQYCDIKLNRDTATIDHVIAKSKGGKNTFSNTVTCCFDCNQKKGDSDLEEVGMELIRRPFTPVWPNINSSPDIWVKYLIR